MSTIKEIQNQIKDLRKQRRDLNTTQKRLKKSIDNKINNKLNEIKNIRLTRPIKYTNDLSSNDKASITRELKKLNIPQSSKRYNLIKEKLTKEYIVKKPVRKEIKKALKNKIKSYKVKNGGDINKSNLPDIIKIQCKKGNVYVIKIKYWYKILSSYGNYAITMDKWFDEILVIESYKPTMGELKARCLEMLNDMDSEYYYKARGNLVQVYKIKIISAYRYKVK